MATWVTHFRIAEKLINQGLTTSNVEFLVGNIGPDCGLPTEDGKGFSPSKEITHFIKNKTIIAEDFFDQYLSNQTVDFSNKKYSFYVGYYFHLVTDQEWSKLYQKKMDDPIYQEIKDSPKYGRIIKKDWYGLDFLYLMNNKDHIFWNTFQHIAEFPDYLEFFDEGQILKQIKRISHFYLNSSISTEHEFKYLTMEEVNVFVDDTIALLQNIIRDRFL